MSDTPTTQNNGARLRKGLAYSPLADVALKVGRIAALVGVVASVLHFLIAASEIDLGRAFIALLAFFLCLAVGVVFVRVQDQ